MRVFISSFFKSIKAIPTEFPGARKTEDKKKSPIFFALTLNINKNFPDDIFSDFSKFAIKKCVTMLKLT